MSNSSIQPESSLRSAFEKWFKRHYSASDINEHWAKRFEEPFAAGLHANEVKRNRATKALIELHDYFEICFSENYPADLAEKVRSAIKINGENPDWETQDNG